MYNAVQMGSINSSCLTGRTLTRPRTEPLMRIREQPKTGVNAFLTEDVSDIHQRY